MASSASLLHQGKVSKMDLGSNSLKNHSFAAADDPIVEGIRSFCLHQGLAD